MRAERLAEVNAQIAERQGGCRRRGRGRQAAQGQIEVAVADVASRRLAHLTVGREPGLEPVRQAVTEAMGGRELSAS